MFDNLLNPIDDESSQEYWQRQNKTDTTDIGLYCQSCCYRYPEECLFVDMLHPYDRYAEVCPDFVPKDMYKPKSKAKCWLKRLEVEPDYSPLPMGEIRHSIDWYGFVPISTYYRVMTKMKALDYVEYKKTLKNRKLFKIICHIFYYEKRQKQKS
jgi:hypothetical protein